jgi:hypothetical protein
MLFSLPWSKLRIPIVTFQIMSTYVSITGLPLPKIYNKLLKWAGLINFDLGWVVSIGCVLRTNFYQRLLVITIAPIVATLTLACSYAIARCRQRVCSADSRVELQRTSAIDKAWDRHVTLFLTMTFYIYSTVSTALFQIHACDSIDDRATPHTRYLRADYSLQCGTSKHRNFQIYAGVMTALYVAGIPFLYAVILWCQRKELNRKPITSSGATAVPTAIFVAGEVVFTTTVTLVQDEVLATESGDRDTNKDLMSTGFLWRRYKPQHFYYEVVESGRRLLLTGGIVFIAPGTAAQAASACMLAFISMVIAMYIQPHKDSADGLLYYAGCINIVLSTFLSVCMKVDISVETQDSQKAFDILLVTLNGFTLFATLVQMGYSSYIAVKHAREIRKTAAKRVGIEDAETPATAISS